jgi:hypothetical protein
MTLSTISLENIYCKNRSFELMQKNIRQKKLTTNKF